MAGPPDSASVSDLVEAMPIGAYDAEEFPTMIEGCTRALTVMATEDLQVSFVAGGGFRGDFEGIDGFRDAWLDWLEPFSTYSTDLEETRLGPSVAVLLTRQRVTPREGETAIEAEAAAVAWWSDGKVNRLEFHLDRALALQTAGLEPN